MAIPANKKELTEAIRTHYAKLKEELENIPPGLTSQKELEGHAKNTSMSVKDLMAYLFGWALLVIKWNRHKEKGIQVDFPETGFKWNELGRLAQKFYDDHKKDSYQGLLKKLDEAVLEINTIIHGKTNKQLYETTWYDKWTPGRMIQLNTSSPYQNARLRIRKWKKQKGLK